MIMKKTVLFATIIAFAGCGKQKEDKKAELQKLKTEQESLNKKIKQLEKEVATSGTSVNSESSKVVSVREIRKQYFEHYLEVQGKVDADENIAVSAEMSGIVKQINVKEGQQVSKGQVLAELDNRIIQQGVAELQGSIDLANTMFQKQKSLWDQKIGTEVQFLSAKNQKESLELKMATLKEQLAMSRIKSPINGTVDEVSLKLGQAVMPGMPAVRVVNSSNLKIKAEVAESYYGSVKQGAKVLVNFPNSSDSLVTQVSYATKVVNPLNRTYTVEVRLNNNNDFHPNMTALLKINDYKSTKPVITVPVANIQNSEEGQFVYISQNLKVRKVLVKVGRIYNGMAEILSGLNEGDLLIIKGQDLNEGEQLVTAQ